MKLRLNAFKGRSHLTALSHSLSYHSQLFTDHVPQYDISIPQTSTSSM